MRSLVTLVFAAATTGMVQAGPVASVNGVEIQPEQLEELKQESQTRFGTALPETELMDTLIRTEVVKQAAAASGIDKSESIAKKVKAFKEQLIISEYMQQLSSTLAFSDSEYKKAYDEFIKTYPSTQYKARHILSKEEAEAKAIIKALEDGADFASLAKEKSIGPSGKTGGDLGWFEPGAMVKEFSEATVKLKKGSYSKEPVKTQFGYHVILLEDMKKNTPPSLEELKPELKGKLMPVKLLEAVEALTAKAKIERFDTKK